MVTVLIIGILASIAYPSYIDSTTRSKRRAAAVCLSSYATHMERFYTTNMRYDEDTANVDIVLPDLDCAGAQSTGKFYTYSFATGQPTATTYTLQAAPKSTQATRDTGCGTLTITHAGVRGAGSSGVEKCW